MRKSVNTVSQNDRSNNKRTALLLTGVVVGMYVLSVVIIVLRG
jgi:hypothetical protein